ncbi:ATP-binding cassette domain-containing protein [Lacinutrix sp.]|uniref:ATP-binding cassette domain-containing protein n=1 Tax=Lacinutrix sp. TaxID=1937692 RepID=UPI0025C19AD0|nr:ATP-binding cassette domain-containing protein [Lacinutrix sp.]
MRSLFVDSITKSYNNRVILSDIFLSCEIGEIKGLIGRNGCGKSTLLKIIFGVEKAENKFVRVHGKLINNTLDCKGLINYLPQKHFLPNGIKISKIINLFLEKRYREKLLSNQFVKPLLNRTSQELSGGERRIVEILLLIHSNSKFILLDEPFNGVSPILKEYIAECILEVSKNKGVIITDHDYENVLKIADTITFLKDGYLREIKERSELIELGYFVKVD